MYSLTFCFFCFSLLDNWRVVSGQKSFICRLGAFSLIIFMSNSSHSIYSSPHPRIFILFLFIYFLGDHILLFAFKFFSLIFSFIPSIPLYFWLPDLGDFFSVLFLLFLLPLYFNYQEFYLFEYSFYFLGSSLFLYFGCTVFPNLKILSRIFFNYYYSLNYHCFIHN